MSALSLAAEKRASDQIKALDLKGIREKPAQSSGTASQVSALERKAKARSSVSVSSITGSRVTGTSFPAQACGICGYQTFQGDKFCGGCGGRLLTRKEYEALANGEEGAPEELGALKSGSAVGSQLSRGSRS